MDLNVNDRVFVITGAGGGIGRATVLRFVASGARIVATDLDEKVARARADAIEAAGGEALAIAHDVSSEAAWLDVLGRAEERLGGVDVLVNNAGIFIIAPIEATTLDQWEKIMAINVTGTFLGAKHVVPYLRKRGGGSIINMSSVSGVRGSANDAAYGASKDAVTLLPCISQPNSARTTSVSMRWRRPWKNGNPVRGLNGRFRDRMLERPNLGDC
jgi:NAD(P)-dependent dehydrogenase (short-subunit alcohol dehydrogenase family)